ncbi:MAG TPA: efflux RND transporter periplasmic adaptor subunit [Thermoanaerobaculia bacterium]|jgi:RND family efflux transporter MFP subunit|nr:efflux RND transporter periplasmic adaptor subunit [Thermoanaerobaculia bacterium]
MIRIFSRGVLIGLLGAGYAAGAGEKEPEVYPSHLMVDQEVTVSARITGVIEKINVDRGSVVKRGQSLAQLELQEFEQGVREAKEEMQLRKVELERAQALSAGNIMSKAELDEKRARHAVAQAAWEKARAIRDYAFIRAPFTGVVTEKFARVGQKVIDNQNVPLFKITAFEPLLARVYLPEQWLMRIRRGDRVEVVPEKFPNARTTGVVQYISPTVDAASGTFQIIVQVRRDPSQPILRPGLAVKVLFNNAGRS